MTPCESHCSGLFIGSEFSSQGLNHQISFVVLGGVSLSSSLSMENLSIWYFCRREFEEHCIALDVLLSRSRSSESIVAEVCVFIFFFSISFSIYFTFVVNWTLVSALQFSLTLKGGEKAVIKPVGITLGYTRL